MIVIADLHLREESEDVVFNQVFPGIRNALQQDPGSKTLAILGDIYHIRYRVNVRLQNRMTAFLEELTQADGASVILLPGNHDQIDVKGENALEIFGRLPGCLVYSQPTWNSHGLWIPYRKRPEDIAEALARALSYPNPDVAPPVLWMHHGIQGMKMTNNRVATEGLPPDMFKNFKHVYCGHWHGPQTQGNVTYIGSPYQTRADEYGQVKRYGIWHGDSQIMNFVNVEWGKRYHFMRIGEEAGENPADIVMPDVRPGDEVRITTAPGVDPSALYPSLAQYGANFVVTPDQISGEARLEVAPDATMTDYAAEYVKQFSGKLDDNRLMKVFAELTQ